METQWGNCQFIYYNCWRTVHIEWSQLRFGWNTQTKWFVVTLVWNLQVNWYIILGGCHNQFENGQTLDINK